MSTTTRPDRPDRPERPDVRPDLPDWLAACERDHDEALRETVRSGARIGSGLGTSEPSSFYARLWDHVLAHDVHDIEIRQALFLDAHPILVGDAMDVEAPDLPGPLDTIADRLTDAVRLRRLAAHLDALAERRITFLSAFLGPAMNMRVPDSPVTRAIAPSLAGRNRVTAGMVRYQPVHFPDAADALARDPDTGELSIDLFVQPVTWPRDGELSFGLSNGVNGDVADDVLDSDRARLLLYLNRQLPFTRGRPDAPNTFPVDRLRRLADDGRLTLVVEDTTPPGLPAGSFDEPEGVTADIGARVAAHIADHLDLTAGRALQVGIGETSVSAVRQLDAGPWTGRAVTELLDPVTYSLLDDGTVDAPIVCTFAMGERGSDFPARLDGDDRIEMVSASTLLQPRVFAGGLGINNVLAIDFNGQVNATARDHIPYSGVGGLATIMRGLADGGVAYLCLRSTHTDLDGNERSSIMPALPEGTPVTLTGFDLMGRRNGARVYLATEYGIAALHGRPQDALVRELVAVAHPDHRDRLRHDSAEIGYL
jgi:acyl-CoA hydrolase